MRKFGDTLRREPARVHTPLCTTLIVGLVFFMLAPVPGRAAEKILVALTNDTTTWFDNVLHTLNPDGTGLAKLFDFSDNALDPTGSILQPRVAPGKDETLREDEPAYN